MNTVTKKRMEILNGKLFMPKIQKLRMIYGETIYQEVEKMFEAMWYAYLKEGEKGTISLPYWAKRINNPKAMNIALMMLSKSKWIISKSLPTNNWGEAKIQENKLLEFCTIDELGKVRKANKFAKYFLKPEPEAKHNNIVKLNGKIRKTGLVREGFRKSGNVEFEFDTGMMSSYRKEVIDLINKGINKMIQQYPDIKNDLANYSEVGKEIMEHYLWNDGTYSAGQNYIDSRGRNISGMLNKIGNPIGFKIMRSLLIIPEPARQTATEKGLKSKYLFIAELLGFKDGTVKGKENFGRRAYFSRKFNDLELPRDIDDLYENIWLERLYNEIDFVLGINMSSNWKKKANLNKYRIGKLSMTETAKNIETFELEREWYVPIEIDMSASVLGYMGILLNHKPFMERTNMIGRRIGDAWGHDVITNRIQFKTIMRVCYGSNMPASDMWKEMDIPYTKEEVAAFELELDNGSISVANRFKNFIIQNVKPSEDMEININNEKFKIECNRYTHIGEVTNKFDLYDTFTNSIRRISNTSVAKRPNLDAFRRFFVTALIHNLDSQVENNTTDAVIDAYDWCIDIHDALILDCEAAEYGRKVYCKGRNKEEPSIEQIHRDRNIILGKYFTSINISSTKTNEWKNDVMKYVEPFDGIFKCNQIVLK